MYKQDRSYSGYRKVPSRDITVPELYELVLNMKIENRDIYDGAITGTKIAVGTITSDLFDDSLTLEASRIIFDGQVFGEGAIFKGDLQGGTITADTVINVGTDLRVGNNIYLGDQADEYSKAIRFNQDTRILANQQHMLLNTNTGFFFNVGEEGTIMSINDSSAYFKVPLLASVYESTGGGGSRGYKFAVDSTDMFFSNYHTLTAHQSGGDAMLYVQRFTNRDWFTIRSHHELGNFVDVFRIGEDGEVYMPETYSNVTTGTSNIRVDSTTGEFTRSTSLREYKLAIETAKNPYAILDIEPRTWYDKVNTERYASTVGKDDSDLSRVSQLKRIGGLVAEEVVDAGLDIYAEYDEEGNLTGVAYDRIWTLLIPIVKDILARLDAIEKES